MRAQSLIYAADIHTHTLTRARAHTQRQSFRPCTLLHACANHHIYIETSRHARTWYFIIDGKTRACPLCVCKIPSIHSQFQYYRERNLVTLIARGNYYLPLDTRIHIHGVRV